MSGLTIPPGVPRFLKSGLWWLVIFVGATTWTGWLEAPGSLAVRQRTEVTAMAQALQAQALAIAEMKATQQVETARTREDVREIKALLETMSMVVYSLERRTP